MNSPDPDEDQLADELAAYDEALRKRREPIDAMAAAELRDVLDRLEQRFPRQHPADTQEFSNEQQPSVDTPQMTDQQIGRFQVLRELGRGGFGVVFQAYDPQLQRHVALKVPRTDSLLLDVMRNRFLHEAKAAAALDHPYIVPIYEVNEIGPLCYIALAYCDGPDLAQWLAERKEPVPPQQAAAIIAAIAEGVEHAHERGILHRDLKPANILLVPTSDASDSEGHTLPFTPRVTDFGMAKLLDAGLTDTRSSVVMGTPLYMAPEQAEGRSGQIGPGADVYALGAILYELLTSRTPFEGQSLVGLLDELRTRETPASPRQFRESIPTDLETICLKCLRREPSQRYLSAADLSADLRRYLNQEPILARNLTWYERLLNWSRRQQRIRDAGVGIILMQVILTLWVIVCITLAGSAYQGEDLIQTRIQGGMTLLCFSMPLTAFGTLLLLDRRWVIPIALFISFVGQTLLPIMILSGKVQMLEGYYNRQPYFETTNLSLVAFCGLTQTVLLGLALIANHADRERSAVIGM